MNDYFTAFHTIREIDFELHPLKAMWWKNKSSLIVSDLHVGKAAHFRKNGIAIHTNANKNNYWNLSSLLDHYRPERLLIIGDLSHSSSNSEWDSFVDFRKMYNEMNWVLVDGNHDVLSTVDYELAGIDTLSELIEGELRFVHDNTYQDNSKSDLYTLSGHIHPAIRLVGSARQRIRLDCFYFNDREGILPAFGEFTGRKVLKPKKEDQVYAIAENKVIQIPTSKLSR